MSHWAGPLLKKAGVKVEKESKYKSKRVKCPLHWHQSGAEGTCCCYFQFLEKRGELVILKSQPNVRIPEACKTIIPDWLLRYKDGREVYADYKGHNSDTWRHNRRVWKKYGPKPLEVWHGNGWRFFASETIQGGNDPAHALAARKSPGE